MRILTILIAALFMYTAGYAQKQDNVWCMGHGGGVDFNTNPPTAFQSKMKAIETTASISDRNTGALLFYTDGSRIWDASHNVMQNGSGIGLNESLQSVVQGALILPFFDDENKYYVFTLPSIIVEMGVLYYSVVDMTLNNGLGGVVPDMKKIKISNGFSEALIAIPGCEMVWLLTQNRYNGDFHAYKVTRNGVDSKPVVSPLGHSKIASLQTGFKATPDFKKILTRGEFLDADNIGSYLALYDFDAATGKMLNAMLIDTSDSTVYYGCEFSPNGKRLYASGYGNIFQYNLSLPTPSAIVASKTSIGQPSTFANGMQLRDDGNIYVVRYESDFLGRISNADALAPGCIYTDEAVEIGGRATYNVPAKIVYPSPAPEGIGTKKEASICNDAPAILRPDHSNPTWQDGSKDDTYTATQAGIYWARGYTADCKVNTDTFFVDEVTVDVTIGNDTTICPGATIVLQSNAQPSGTTYRWSNGSQDDNMVVTGEGTYGLAVTYKGCSDADEITVSHHPDISVELGNDTIVCNDVKMMLPQKSAAGSDDKFVWQDGTTGNTLEVTKGGKYFVTIDGKCGAVSDSITITRRNCSLFFPSAFSPNRDGKNDILRMLGDVTAISDYTLKIYNRWGQQVFTATNPLQGWNGMHGADIADMGTYYYYIQYKYKGETEMMKGDITLVR